MGMRFSGGLLLREADLGQLRVGVGDGGYELGFHLGRHQEQGAADDDLGMIVGGVREGRCAGHVADGIDAGVGGPEAGVDGDAAAVMADAGGVEAQLGDVGPASGRQQQDGVPSTAPRAPSLAT